MCFTCDARSLGRRGLFATGAALLATAVAPAAQAQTPARPDTPAAAMQELVEGNARYAANLMRRTDFSARRATLAQGQAPFAAVLGCADSRVAPELAFDQGPGDLFVVRVAGNFVTPDGLGSLEFGAAVLGAKVILVLGHTSCGAVNATVEALQKGNTLPGHIASLVTAMKPGIEPALAQPGDDLIRRALVANVRHSVRTLETSTPILADMVARGALAVKGGIYDLATGRVELI
ncbi:carbonic anhydrase [Neoroseomonas lacus]|uniref:carbonic anhydrase n=1 Tax=Neoroseomonas lacus TaxID=287609 RepID=A0A917NMB5_9PROT|nr:carbonic anhydrase [Neoroseomonas lacus]GGJ08677.1 carbonic anhydrase [Neoroseomonas lacus]